MPTPALPRQEPTPLANGVRLYREYRDMLGRPMDGKAVITGTARSEAGVVVVPAAPVTVDIVGGVLDVSLPPDTYTVVAELRTVERRSVSDSHTITLATEPA